MRSIQTRLNSPDAAPMKGTIKHSDKYTISLKVDRNDGTHQVYSVSRGGAPGVQRAIALLKAEIDRDLALLGIRKLSEITPDLVRKF
mgnify:CR=1 FL=1